MPPHYMSPTHSGNQSINPAIGATKKGPRGCPRQNGANKERDWGEKDQNGVLSFMKISLVSPSLDQKEQNCFGTPNFKAQLRL